MMPLRPIPIAVAVLVCAGAAQAQLVNIDATHGFTYDGGGSDPAPLPGQHINPIGARLLLTLDPGTYTLRNAAGQPGALFDAWSFNVGTASWYWAFVTYDAATDKVLGYFAAGDVKSSAGAVAAQAAVRSFSEQLVLAQRTTVGFTLRDYYVPDNAGGISVQLAAVTPVPEPVPAALLAAGLASLGLLLRRRALAAGG